MHRVAQNEYHSGKLGKRGRVSTAISVGMLAQQQVERRFSRTARLSHGLEENLRTLNRAVSARAVNLPTP